MFHSIKNFYCKFVIYNLHFVCCLFMWFPRLPCTLCLLLMWCNSRQLFDSRLLLPLPCAAFALAAFAFVLLGHFITVIHNKKCYRT